MDKLTKKQMVQMMYDMSLNAPSKFIYDENEKVIETLSKNIPLNRITYAHGIVFSKEDIDKEQRGYVAKNILNSLCTMTKVNQEHLLKFQESLFIF